MDDYLLGRLSAEELVQVEEHILICETCLEVAQMSIGFIAAIRDLRPAKPAAETFHTQALSATAL
jgi:hypothetical protein